MSLYRRYLKVCTNWEVDVNKDGRDFGQLLRKKLPYIFKSGEATVFTYEEAQKWDKKIASLERLAAKVDNKSSSIQSVTNLDVKLANYLTSNEAQSYMKRLEKETLLQKIKQQFQDIEFFKSKDKV